MEILKQNKAILGNYGNVITTSNNPNSTSGIYLTAEKYTNSGWWLRIEEKSSRQKRKQQRIQPPARFVFNKNDLKLFRNYITAWTASCIHLDKP